MSTPKKKLILVPSKKMDSNKKEDRDEQGLVRMSATARKNMEFQQDSVELWQSGNGKKITTVLSIFQAFSSDVKRLKSEGYTNDELKRVGFVSTTTYQKITGDKPKVNDTASIWISPNIEDIMFGADPEFLIFDKDDKIIRANNVLDYNGLLGCDGAMAEIRPKPDQDISQLVKNMQTIFANHAPDNIKQYNWRAACYYKDDQRDYPVGGHIHIGNPLKVAKMQDKQKDLLFKVMNKILDELLAVPMIKLDGTEKGCARRTKCTMGKYGYFGEYRIHSGRLEHRTLSGMWLLHPSLSKAVIGTAKAIVDEIYRYVKHNEFKTDYFFPDNLKDDYGDAPKVWGENFDKWKDIPLAQDMNCIASSEKMIGLLNASKTSSINTSYLNRWYTEMKRMTTYKKNSYFIDGLYEILKIPGKELQEWDREIKNNWLSDKKFIVNV